MTADRYARLDAAYLLGALDANESLTYEAHLAICRRCRASLAEISPIPPLLAGLDESVFAAPPEAAAMPVPDTLLPRLLQAAGRERAHRRRRTTGLVLLAAACAIALLVIVLPSSSGGPKPAPRAMAALVATYDLGSWRLAPGRRVIFTSGTSLTETQIKNLQITQPNGRAILAFRVPG
jgi:anti-sigma factor RsiW